MALNLKLSLIAAAGLTLAACGQAPDVAQSTRMNNSALLFYDDTVQGASVPDQVAALNEAADRLVRRSQINGALVGAALGCGVTLATGSSSTRDCVAAAALGGAAGAVLGTQRGEREVARRVALVAEGDVARQLNAATGQMAALRQSLPAYLADQEAELNRLTMQQIKGQITQQEHDIAVLEIQQQRLDLGGALELSARDARTAAANLRAATQRGQTGLDWHIQTADALVDDVESAQLEYDLMNGPLLGG
ncbi:hypothetical protein [Pseudooctadecabacter sp.]|uniref:hypothetical protein n=1 Tax=Pseudooctadecabacter sp. TaxID=1966338 RepID=UPI0035C7F99E